MCYDESSYGVTMRHRNVRASDVSIGEVACYRTERALLGCAYPRLEGRGTPSVCSSQNELGTEVDGLGINYPVRVPKDSKVGLLVRTMLVNLIVVEHWFNTDVTCNHSKSKHAQPLL